MSRSICIFVLAFVSVCASSVLANAQAAPSSTENNNVGKNNSAPIAFVYVSSVRSTGSYEIHAYKVASDGTLTAVSGSPFAENGFYLAENGNWLFSTDTVDIYSFSIAANGALRQVSSVNAQQYNQYDAGGPVNLFFDRKGTTLYDEDIYSNQGANNTYQFFDFNQTTGALTYLGATSAASAVWNTPLSFVGNDADGYGSTCVRGGQYIYGFSRGGAGRLSDLNLQTTIPSAPKGSYCPYLTATDLANSVAISLMPTEDGLSADGPTQIAVYSADPSGDLTTNSTSSNMPKVAVGSVTDMKTSPSGKLLAVAGSTGLQVFHFNGANPVTHFTPLMTKDPVDQMFWDNANHLYAVSRSAGKLYVFTVTTTKATPASGSPHAIGTPANLIVVPRT
jgi:hypothetical protein